MYREAVRHFGTKCTKCSRRTRMYFGAPANRLTQQGNFNGFAPALGGMWLAYIFRQHANEYRTGFRNQRLGLKSLR